MVYNSSMNTDRIFNLANSKEKRRFLRHNMSKEEVLLWSKLKGNGLGYKFRRQTGIGRYVVDFYCSEKSLIIEVDGNSHSEDQEYDKVRTEFFKELNLSVIRFWNSEVRNNLSGVLSKIQENLPPRSTTTPPRIRRGNAKIPPMHHAYLLTKEIAEGILSKEDKGNLELLVYRETNFKIDTAREVKDALSRHTFGNKKRIVMLEFITMNAEAQNTLLKVVEEPPRDTVFFFVTQFPERILPTLRSRLESKFDSKVSNKINDIKLSVKELLLESSKIVEGIKSEKFGKDRAVDLLDQIITAMRNTNKPIRNQRMILEMRSYLLDQSSSVKQILESAAALAF